MRYSYTYSGNQAAFILSGVCVLPAGVAVLVEDKEHKALLNNKFVKHLLDHSELSITEVKDDKPTTGTRGGRNAGRGKTGGTNQSDAESSTELEDARNALKDLDIMYADDETLEQLQAKLAQATE